VLGCVVLASLGAGLAQAHQTRRATVRKSATVDARRHLRGVKVPHDARPVDCRSAEIPQVIQNLPAESPSSPTGLVIRARCWVDPLAATAVRSFIAAHAPPGSSARIGTKANLATTSGSALAYPATLTWHPTPRLTDRLVQVNAFPRPDGGTAILAQGWDFFDSSKVR
jgi:hypothetical protein